MAQKFRSYAFTYFWKTREDITLMQSWLSSNAKYAMYGEELCPTTGKPHLQGWIYFKNERSFDAISKKFTWHIEPLKKSFEAIEKYCRGLTKEKTPNEIVWAVGEMPNQGARTDLVAIRDRIVKGEKVDDLCMEQPNTYHCYGRVMHRIEDIQMRKLFRTFMTLCKWYWGRTGVGKSHEACHNFHPDTHYIWKNDNGWQDDYKQQETVVINDFRGEIPYNEFLQMVDKWPYYVRRRNRPPLPFMSKMVIVTSSLPPELVYRKRDAEDKIEQLLRRVEVICLDKPADAGAEVVPVILKEKGLLLKNNLNKAIFDMEEFLANA